VQRKQSEEPPDYPPWRPNELVVREEAVDEVRKVLGENGISIEPRDRTRGFVLVALQPPPGVDQEEDVVHRALELLRGIRDTPKAVAEPNYIHGCPQMRGGQFALPDPIPPPDVEFRPSPVGDGVRVLVLDTLYVAPPLLDPFVPSVGTPADIEVSGELVACGGHSSFVVGQILRVAPGAEVSPVALLDNDGQCDDWALRGALIDALANPPHLVNLSLGCRTLDDQLPSVLKDPIDDLIGSGAVIVAAAGNEDALTPWFPAAYGTDQPGVYGVGAVVRVFRAWWRAAYSNYGDWVRAVAPGMLEGPFLEWHDGPQPYEGWARWIGTSFATPLVTGAIAALMSRDPALNPRDAADALLAASPLWSSDQPPPATTDFGDAPVINPPALWP
jgi:Subtilase family